MYYRGTLSEFNSWHTNAKASYGIPVEGLIGYVNGNPAPQNERTINYVEAIRNPYDSNECVWAYGAYPIIGKESLSQEDVDALEWLKEGA